MAKLKDLQLGTGGHKPFTFTRKKQSGEVVTVTVLIRALTKHQIDAARLDALTTIKDLDPKIREGATYEQLMLEAQVVEKLSRALLDPEKPDEQWATPMEIARAFDLATIHLLAEEYERHQQACSPFLQDMSDTEFEAMVDAIAAEGRADPFYLCALPLQSAFITTLARRLVESRMANSSSSSGSTARTSSGETAGAETGTAAPGDDLRETVGDLLAELGVHRDEIASLSVRVTHLEAASTRPGPNSA